MVELAASRLLNKLGTLEDAEEANKAVGNLSKLKVQYSTFLGKEIENTDDVAYKMLLESNISRLEQGFNSES